MVSARIALSDFGTPRFQLWLSTDRGLGWVPIHQFVKAFFWSPYRILLVERTEPSGMNTVLKLDLRNLPWYQRASNAMRVRMSIRKEFIVVIQNVEDFQVRGDYMFATMKNSKVSIMLHMESLVRGDLTAFIHPHILFNRMERRNIWICTSPIKINRLSKRILTRN